MKFSSYIFIVTYMFLYVSVKLLSCNLYIHISSCVYTCILLIYKFTIPDVSISVYIYLLNNRCATFFSLFVSFEDNI